MFSNMPSSKTYDFRGVKTVYARSTGYEKLRYSAVLCAMIFQDKDECNPFKLPPMIIFKNFQTSAKGNFPVVMAIIGTPAGMMTKELMVEQFLVKVLSRTPEAFFGNPKTLLIMDTSPGHLGDEVKKRTLIYCMLVVVLQVYCNSFTPMSTKA